MEKKRASKSTATGSSQRKPSEDREPSAAGKRGAAPQQPSAMSNPLFDAQANLLKAGWEAFLDARAKSAAQLAAGGFPSPLQDGVKKLEEVFDARVAGALDRIGMPSPQALQELSDRVAKLTAEVEQLKKTIAGK